MARSGYDRTGLTLSHSAPSMALTVMTYNVHGLPWPIEQSWRAAFPRADCAGFDCLANKGALLARIAVPGVPVPVQIVTAHMNSRVATYTPGVHADEAYVREAQSLNQFIQEHADSRQPLILAADLNVSWSPIRLAAMETGRTFWLRGRDGMGGGSIHAICATPRLPCRLAAGFDSLQPHRRNNDWQIFLGGREMAVRPSAPHFVFGPIRPAGRFPITKRIALRTACSLPGPLEWRPCSPTDTASK